MAGGQVYLHLVPGDTTCRAASGLTLADYDHPIAIGWSRYLAEASTLLPTRAVATSLATQALIPDTMGRHQMNWVPHVSS